MPPPSGHRQQPAGRPRQHLGQLSAKRSTVASVSTSPPTNHAPHHPPKHKAQTNDEGRRETPTPLVHHWTGLACTATFLGGRRDDFRHRERRGGPAWIRWIVTPARPI